MKSEIKSKNGLVREIEVEVPADKVDAAFAQRYTQYRKEARIKGFRPGKAPLGVVKSIFYDAIRDDVLQDLISKTYPEAIRQQDLKVASPPEFSEHDLKEGNPLKYTAKIEVMPEIEKVDYDDLVLPQQEFEVHDSEVDAVIQHIRKKNAENRTVDRPAKTDDLLLMDMEKLDDPGNVLHAGVFNDIEIDLSGSETVHEFKETLTGIRPGEEREVIVNYPEDFSNETLAGKMVKYLCKVKEVRERILPLENDGFAKSQGDFATMLELRLRIRKDIEQQKFLDHRKWEKDELMRQILAKNEIPVPETMTSRYIESIVEDMRKTNRSFNEATVREQYRPVADNSIRWNLIIERLLEIEGIEVLPSDTENWIKGFAQSYNMEIDKAKEVLAQTGKNQEIRDSILEDKVFDFLLSKVTYMPATPEVKLSGDSESAAADDKDDKENIITEEK